MSEVAIIFSAEFLRRLQSRAYVVGTAAGLFFVAILALSPLIASKISASSSKTLVLAGPAALRDSARTLLSKDFTIADELERLPAHPDAAFLDAHGHASAAIALRAAQGGLRVQAYARDLSAFSPKVARDLAPLNIALATQIPTSQIRTLLAVPLELHGVDSKFANEAAADVAHAVAYGLIMILYLSTLINGQAVLASVAEEKTNRIAEILVATVSPARLLAGKLLATGALGLLQVGVWIAAAFLILPFTIAALGPMTTAGGDAAVPAAAVSPGAILAFVAFFIVGFAQFSTMYAAAASLINRTEDVGSVQMPLIFPIIIALLLAQYTLAQPASTASLIASFVPLISPFVMFTRIAVADVPAWQIVLSLAINVIAALAIVEGAGRVYRVGLLLYGRAPNFRQIVAAIRTSG